MGFLMIVFALIGHFSSSLGSVSSPSRFCVIENRVGNQSAGSPRMIAFQRTAAPVSVQVSYGDADTSWAKWSSWQTLGAPLASQPLSNPCCLHTQRNQTQIFVQASDGQVYTTIQNTIDFLKFSPWEKVGSTSIPASQPKISVPVDSVSVVWYGKQLMVFARSISGSASRLYWCKGTSASCTWGLVAGKTTLGTDATIIKNPFTAKYEAFMISRKGKMHRSWQHANGNSFAAWKAMASSPTFSIVSKPVAQIMGYNIFNGKIMIGGIGKDNFVHRCAQAACDTVENPWSYCTWGSWHQTGGKIPFAQGGVQNNLAMSRTVHYGVEIFGVQETNGQLWQAWQPQRDTSWNAWRKVPQNLTRAAFINNPFIRVNEAGWWIAYGLNAKNQVIVTEAARSMSITPKKVAWDMELVVSWSVSEDEASNEDWIGIYPTAANNNQYLDYRYVQGGLNPGKNIVSAGKVSMTSYLPNGSYQVRYLVNRKYIGVMEMDVTFYNGSQESDLMQLFRGIYAGLGVTDDITACVDEGLETVKSFEDCFHAFEAGKVFQGLQHLGIALEDVAHTLLKCRKMFIVQPLLVFIKDLLQCIQGNCINFLIDVGKELRILFLNRYEIYGDIRGAANSFRLPHAHQQGGLCIGRMVKACLGLEASLMSNGTRQVVELNGTFTREEMKLSYQSYSTYREKVIGTGRKEVFEIAGNSGREGVRLIEIGRREEVGVIDTNITEGMDMIDTGRKVVKKVIRSGK